LLVFINITPEIVINPFKLVIILFAAQFSVI